MLIGLCCRSTSSAASNDECLLKWLRRTLDQGGNAHVVIMGDFNFRDIDYEHGSVKAGPKVAASKFFKETQRFISRTACACVYSFTGQTGTVNIGLYLR